MRRAILLAIIGLAAFGCTGTPFTPGGRTQIEQGPNWGLITRAKFYSIDQGAQIMPLRWLKALNQRNNQPFLADRLTRYGYLENQEDPASILPAGFTSAGPPGAQMAGMNCAACHTREITVKGAAWRIDGGPAIADFQSFLADLDTAVAAVLATPTAFQDFAAGVFTGRPSSEAVAALKDDVQLWYKRYHTLIRRALPASPWGPSRLDAVAMIFNRLTGLDIGPPPDYLIPGNIRRADAPVRYPFLWDAAIQDHTQWPGFAQNGDDLLGLARNLGEVYGVFALFHPTKDPNGLLLNMNYRPDGGNSANFKGLEELETLIRQIGPPKFPWPVDQALVKQGEAIFARDPANGGCAACHQISPGQERLLERVTWKTPVMDVGTDSREHNLLARTADTGVLRGAILPLAAPLGQSEPAFKILATAVVGTILDKLLPAASAPGLIPPPSRLLVTKLAPLTRAGLAATPEAAQLRTAFKRSDVPGIVYESRVMRGIWAAAPYLHNGSVPTLTDLLKPAAERPAAFKVGPEYDPDAVGLAPVQTKFDFTLRTTGCEDRNSGNSRCGHEFGTTTLTPAEKRALLEYLKQL